MLIAEQVALDAVRELRPLVARIRKHDRALHDQVRRAVNSMVLNIAEASASDAGNARARYCTASGSAEEVSAGLRLAVAWGDIEAAQVAKVECRLDRVRRLLWGLRR